MEMDYDVSTTFPLPTHLSILPNHDLSIADLIKFPTPPVSDPPPLLPFDTIFSKSPSLLDGASSRLLLSQEECTHEAELASGDCPVNFGSSTIRNLLADEVPLHASRTGIDSIGREEPELEEGGEEGFTEISW